MSAETPYEIEVTPPDGERHTLRVRGETPNQAIMGAYSYLVRQWDGRRRGPRRHARGGWDMNASPLIPGMVCQWSAACDHPATTLISSAALADRFPKGVPTCDRCAAIIVELEAI